MAYFDRFVWIHIYDPCEPDRCFRAGEVLFVKMSMSVKNIARLGEAYQPVDGFQPIVCQIRVVMDAKGRRVGDEDVERATVLHAIDEQPGEHGVCPLKSRRLGILVDPVGSILDRPPKTADQKFFVTDDLQVQVKTAFGLGLRRFGVVVARHIKHWHVQHGHQIFKVRVGKVAAAEDQFHIMEMPIGCECVHALDDLVADG